MEAFKTVGLEYWSTLNSRANPRSNWRNILIVKHKLYTTSSNLPS